MVFSYIFVDKYYAYLVLFYIEFLSLYQIFVKSPDFNFKSVIFVLVPH